MTQTLERRYSATPDEIWRLWTTPDAIERWWAPEGFAVEVETLELRPGGELRYAMTATAPAQMEFMESAGMPLRTVSRKTFTEVVPNERLAYDSLVDFVPGVEPYEARTVVALEPDGDGTRVVMTMDDLHDAVWTDRLVLGRSNELDNLGALIARR
jgi:uncharacterized protein YndB with AHSA1/START domain